MMMVVRYCGDSAAMDVAAVAVAGTLVKGRRMRGTFHRSHFAMRDGVLVWKAVQAAAGWRDGTDRQRHAPLPSVEPAPRDAAAAAVAADHYYWRPSDADGTADGSC